MTARIFIWVGHPKPGSFCEALADAYEQGAKGAGSTVRRLNLSQMNFDMNGFGGYDDGQPMLEQDLLAWQENISWADHVLFIHPYWWGAMPAKAKAVFDRALAPGFGFSYRGKGVAWDKLLTGKSADVIITSDTPPLIDTLIYKKPARRVMTNQVLGFCGIKTNKAVQFGSVKTASLKKRRKWLKKAENMGMKASTLPSLSAVKSSKQSGNIK